VVRQLLLPVTRARQVDVSGGSRSDQAATHPLEQWRVAVSSAASPSLLVDADGVVQAMSRRGAELLSVRLTWALGRPVLQLLSLVDFHSGAPTQEYAQRIPPLVAVEARLLSRGLFRIAGALGPLTIDAVSAPLYDGEGGLAGSITFFADVNGPVV
jgi:hypothetical protein